MRIYKFVVKDDRLTPSGGMSSGGFSGNRGTYRCEFDFSEDWKDLRRFAVFVTTSKTYTAELERNACIVPYEAAENAGTIHIGVFGSDGNGKIISSSLLPLYILEGAYREGETPEAVTPTVWEKYYAEITKVGGYADRAEAAAESAKAAQSGAESAKDGAKAAQSGAESAKAEAESAVADIKGKLADYETHEEAQELYEQLQNEMWNGFYPRIAIDNLFSNVYTKSEVDEKDTALNDSFATATEQLWLEVVKKASTDDLAALKKATDSDLAALKRKALPRGLVSGYPASLTNALADETLIGLKVYGNHGKNLLSFPFYEKTVTRNGITFTISGDGSVTANGTATQRTPYFLKFRKLFTLEPKKYALSGCPTGGGDSSYQIGFDLYNGETGLRWFKDNGSGTVFDLSSLTFTGASIYIRIFKGTTVNNLVFKPQLEEGDAVSEYEPYKTVGNLDSASGKYLLPVAAYGKNLIPYPYKETTKTDKGITFTVRDDGGITINGSNTSEEYATFRIFVNHSAFIGGLRRGDVVTLSAKELLPDSCHIQFNGYADAKQIAGGAVYWKVPQKSVTIGDDWQGIVLIVYVKAGATIENFTLHPQIERGDTATSYEPYKPPQKTTAYLDAPLKSGEHVDFIAKKRYSASGKETDITVEGEITALPYAEANTIISTTDVPPQKIEAEYFLDISKELAEIKDAILSGGGNV